MRHFLYFNTLLRLKSYENVQGGLSINIWKTERGQVGVLPKNPARIEIFLLIVATVSICRYR